MNRSLWEKTETLSPRPCLPGDLNVEVAVIGGGLAGILTAYFFARRGANTIVLEADRVGGGQTCHTTAKITAQHGLIYAKLTEQLNPDLARQYAMANRNAVVSYRKLVDEGSIPCDWEERAAYLYTCRDGDILKREAEAACALELSAAFTTKTDLPFPVTGAVRLEGQAQFHPLKFLYALADRATVYEHTRVLRAEGHRLYTEHGVVTAKHIVFAAHYPFPLTPGFYFARMHQERSYVLALENAALLNGMYLGVDQDGRSFRNSGKYLLLGGCGHRTGKNRAGKKYEHLEDEAARLWPECRVYARWSAQDCMTLDGVPYIGRFSDREPDWYVATGFGKWGMTSSMVAAQIISGLALDGFAANAEVFSPQRFTPSASAKSLIKDGLHAARDLSRQLLSPPRAALDALPPGHGGIVEYEGQKAGVYKDEAGGLHVVSTRCPHLGCQVEWNPDEASWDCPCHGSRFDCDGHLLAAPAQTDLDMPGHA